MHNEADRLIDHDDVIVDIHNWHGDTGLGDKRLGTEVWFHIDNNNVAFCHSTRARCHHHVVAHHESLIEPIGDFCAARSTDHRHNSIDAFASQR